MDWNWATRAFLNKIQPQCVFITETEIWPNLYKQCNNRGVPILIINGRISVKTLQAAPWLRSIYKATLDKVRIILARSDIDRDAYMQLGVPSEKIEVTGNIKFASQTRKIRPINIEINRPYVLAASTRDNEEKEIVNAWQSIDHGEHLLVIVPRHPKRLNNILQDIKPLSGHIAVRSKGQAPSSQTEIYIADTIGELMGFIQNAELVFMGGSLVPRGGQNILEPARLGKPIIFGPHMDNFADEAKLLLDHEGAIQVEGTDALRKTLSQLLANPDKASEMGERGQHTLRDQKGVLERYLLAIARHCPPS
jgi:3-deoxy-D-manno-octulosonic-acid transferase